MKTIPQYLTELKSPGYQALARVLTIVENDLPGTAELLQKIAADPQIPMIGVTGPPGAGKSTLVNAMISSLSADGHRVAVLAVDPTSPFNLGALLGDRVRMSAHFNKSNVFIRSVATRGSVGGLSGKIIEMTDVLRAAGFNYILVETVGVGQSEIEIAGLADITMVVLVPEAGDEIQHIKSGLMEIGDVFVVNKADREGADTFASRLTRMLHQRTLTVPVFKTAADREQGITAVTDWIRAAGKQYNDRKLMLYAEKAYQLIRQDRMKDVSRTAIQEALSAAIAAGDFNLYRFVAAFGSSLN